MLGAIVSLVRKPFEYIGILSEPEWIMTEEERELVRKVQQHFQEETKVYEESQGLVTRKTHNSVELVNKFVYRLTEDQDCFDVGDYVTWKMYKSSQGTVIKDVMKVTDKDKFEERSVNSEKIVEVDGPKYVTGSGYVFYLDKVHHEADFNPTLSDFVNLSGDQPKSDTESFDPDPLLFVVKRVSPAQSKIVTGKITSWNSSTGLVNEEVIFDANVCDLSPVLDAPVACYCVQGKYGEYSWRAYKVTRNERRSNSKHFFQVEKVPLFQVGLGETKTVELKIHNDSNDRPCIIQAINFTTGQDHPIIIPHDLPLPCTIIPQTTVGCSIQVKGNSLGRKVVKIKWVIAKKQFPITSTFAYSTVQDSLDAPITERTRPIARSQFIVPGRGGTKPIFRKVHMKDYAIPERLRELCSENATGGFDDIIETRIALQQERPAMAGGLNPECYSEWMHTLLFIEELSEERSYEQLATTASLYWGKDCVTFTFPADSPHSKVVAGDTVYASKPWESIKYESKVWTISPTQMSLKFNPDFESCLRSGAQYKLEFKMNRNSNRRRHQAVDIVLQNLGAEWLFPNEHHVPIPHEQPTIRWFNSNLNLEQQRAVTNILTKNNLPYPYIIYGPPGTGKTVTVVEAILQIVANEPNSRILVTAPTNSAVDQLGVRLLDYSAFDKSDMVRLSGYNAYSSGVIAAQLMDISKIPSLGDPAFDNLIPRNEENIPQMYQDDLYRHKITIGTVTTISHFNSTGLPKGHFTHIIIDEAGQCTEQDTLLPIAMMQPGKTQLVLAGDPMQLGPVISSMLAKEYSLQRSFLDRLSGAYLYRKKENDFRDTNGYNPALITRLVCNYRSLPKIVDVVGSLFYGKDLRSMVPAKGSREARVLESIILHKVALKEKMDSMIFIDVSTPEDQMDGSLSWFNAGEVAQVFYALNFLHSAGVSPDDIGVITPYSLQVKKIYEHLDSLGFISPKVGSVEEFQGQERDVIVLSLVRNSVGNSRRVSNFISEPQRVNVALSRARVLNIIIGNRSTLHRSPLWANIISKCRIIDQGSNRAKASQES